MPVTAHSYDSEVYRGNWLWNARAGWIFLFWRQQQACIFYVEYKLAMQDIKWVPEGGCRVLKLESEWNLLSIKPVKSWAGFSTGVNQSSSINSCGAVPLCLLGKKPALNIFSKHSTVLLREEKSPSAVFGLKIHSQFINELCAWSLLSPAGALPVVMESCSRSDGRGRIWMGAKAGFAWMLSLYPASWHGKCMFLPWGRPALALGTSYELSYPLMARNCDFGLKVAFSKLARLRSLEDMFLVSKTQGPKYARF